jgi:hypothetical protein
VKIFRGRQKAPVVLFAIQGEMRRDVFAANRAAINSVKNTWSIVREISS